jgi:hypothetical protein
LASRRRLVIEQRPSTLNAAPNHSRRESRSIFAAAHEHWVDALISSGSVDDTNAADT